MTHAVCAHARLARPRVNNRSLDDDCIIFFVCWGWVRDVLCCDRVCASA
jgi:hypothetical protein